MKLYTESEVRKAIELSRDTHQEGRAYMERDEYDYSMDEVFQLLTPIELPSDSLCINCDESESTHNICMDCIIKIGQENIQLPSDEDIDNHIEDDFLNSTEVHKYAEEAQLLMKAMCKAGALWMRDKIQGGNK
jgi:hypothetical protein